MDDKEIEDLRLELANLKEEHEKLKGLNETLENDNKAKEERINKLLERNQELYLRVSTPVEKEEEPKTLEEQIEDICLGILNDHKIGGKK